MTIELRIYRLIESLVALKDEKVVAKIEELLRQEKNDDKVRRARIEAYEAKLTPMTKDEYVQRVLEAEEDVKAGRLIDIEDLQKEFEKS